MVEPLYRSLLWLTIIMYNRYCNGKYISERSKMFKYLATKWSISSFRKYILVGLKSDYRTRLGTPAHTYTLQNELKIVALSASKVSDSFMCHTGV